MTISNRIFPLLPFASSVALGLSTGCIALGDDEPDGTATAASQGDDAAGGTDGAETGDTDGNDGNDNGDGDPDDSATTNADGGSDGGDDEPDGSGDDGGDIPPTDNGPGPGPSQDPAPDADAPGEYECDGCPQAMTDTNDFDAGTSSTYAIDGLAAGHDGHGQFFVLAADGHFVGGMLPIDETSGNFHQEVPLFCGDNLVKVLVSNDSGTSAYVRAVQHTGCIEANVRATLAWDETTEEWGFHLVRFGGTIGDDATDCQNRFYCSGDAPDWGVVGNDADNPVQDLDVYGERMGVENIRYASAEDGLTLLVENHDLNGGLVPAGTVYINVAGLPTRVMQIEQLSPMEVLTVAVIDGEEGTFHWVEDLFDCAAEWDSDHCAADLP